MTIIRCLILVSVVEQNMILYNFSINRFIVVSKIFLAVSTVYTIQRIRIKGTVYNQGGILSKSLFIERYFRSVSTQYRGLGLKGLCRV